MIDSRATMPPGEAVEAASAVLEEADESEAGWVMDIVFALRSIYERTRETATFCAELRR